ncbi:TetR family transcriptional regulator [Patulibacter sp. SYSU D01012]|uniref:TetR/AcrR family transcriptional regulator n=1 Tax=Patulibacter sp. SYSU D01012 TaxID=2817381 RepID=UPI001B305518
MTSGQRRDARQNRARILDVARRRFDAGDEELPLNVIAAEAGVGVGTVYRNFPSRLALLAALAAPHLDALRGAIERLADGFRPGALEEAFRVAVATFGAHRELLEVVGDGGPADGAAGDVAPLLALLETLRAAAVAAGELRPEVTAEALRHLVCAVDYAARRSSDPDAARRLHAEIAVRGIRP